MVLQHGNRIRKYGGEQVVRELEAAVVAKETDRLEVAGSVSAEDEIRHRAHEIFLSRNGTPGSAELDWLQAEIEVRAGKGAKQRS